LEGVDVDPVVTGARRRPEAVVLSYERYLALAGGRARVLAALDRQATEAGANLGEDEALELARRVRLELLPPQSAVSSGSSRRGSARGREFRVS
jgi:hypothetical protein